MTAILFVLQIIITIILVISIMLQKSQSIGLGAYSGSNESLFGAKGPAGFLAKFTAVMAIVFVVNTIALSYFYQKSQDSSVLDKVIAEQNKAQTTSKIPSVVPSLPTTDKKLAPISITPKTEANLTNTNETNSTDLNTSK